MIKPGYKTSEFWFTAVSFIFSGLYLLGLLESNNQKEDLIGETSKGVEAVILIIGQLTVLFRYIKGRNDIKKIWWNNEKEKPKVENDKKPKGKKNEPTPRSPKTRTRKPSKPK